MSGGVDSSVAAALLAEQGHEVIGLSMQLYDSERGGDDRSFGSCCSIDDLHDARRVAAAIDIPHYILNFERQFDEQVVSNFVSEYAVGPDAAALRALQQRPEVRDAGRSRARLRRRRASPPATTRASSATTRPAGIVLRRGVDPAKDQAYFLFSLTQEQLARAVFPVGDRPKDAVREYARRRGPAGRRQAGQPGDLLHPRRRLRAFVGAADARGRRRRHHRRRGRPGARPPRRHPPLHGRPAEGARAVALADRRAAVRAGAPARGPAGRRRPEVVARADDADRVGRELDRRGHRAPARASPRRFAIATGRAGDGRDRSATRPRRGRLRQPQIAVTPGQAVVFYDGD